MNFSFQRQKSMTDVFVSLRPPCLCPSEWHQNWRLHTKLCRFGWSTSPDNEQMNNSRDPNQSEIVYISVISQSLDFIYWMVTSSQWELTLVEHPKNHITLHAWRYGCICNQKDACLSHSCLILCILVYKINFSLCGVPLFCQVFSIRDVF